MALIATKTKEEQDFLRQISDPKGVNAGGDGGVRLKSGGGSSAPSQSQKGTAQFQSTNVPCRNRLSHIRVKKAELILFTTQLSVMLDSGVVLSDALDVIAESRNSGPQDVFRTIIISVAEAVRGGDCFSKALMDYPRTFDSMFVSMVKASEASGRMVEMLRVLSGYLSFEDGIKKQIKGVMTYPFIMALMAVAATGTLMFFVLPRFTKIYEARGAALPKLTQILVSCSRILGDMQAMTMIVTGIIVASMLLYFWAGTLQGRRAIDYMKISTPALGTMFTDTVITRSMRIMATMINTGVNLLDTIEVIRNSCDNYYFQRFWSQTDEKIRDGYQLSESMQLSKGKELLGPSIIHMFRAGEKSGKLGEISDKVSVYYEKKLETSIKTAMALIEPIVITILGAVIGTIAIALLLPVFKISSVIAH